MGHIRPATDTDASRIAEIFVFNNRLNYFPIFGDEHYSFVEMQVVPLALAIAQDQPLLARIKVYDDGVVRGFIQVNGSQIERLYVDPCFQGRGVGSALLEHVVQGHAASWLWALAKNARAIGFYRQHGFQPSGRWTYEQGTTERLLHLVHHTAPSPA